MMNKLLLAAIGILVCFAAVAIIFPAFFLYYGLDGRNLLGFAEILALILMMLNGTFVQSPYFRISLFVGVGAIAGLALKILHLPGADETIMLSFSALPILYLIHFLSKKSKDLLDVLKLVTVFSFFIGAELIAFHIFSTDSRFVVSIGRHVILASTFVTFLFRAIIARTLFRS